MRYVATVEAQGYGETVEEAELLLEKLPEPDGDLRHRVQVDDDQGLIMVRMMFEAADALDAHETARATWEDAWRKALGRSENPMIFRITARPATPDDAEAFDAEDEDEDEDLAGVGADPFADVFDPTET